MISGIETCAIVLYAKVFTTQISLPFDFSVLLFCSTYFRVIMNIYCTIDFILYITIFYVQRCFFLLCLSLLVFFELVANSHAYKPQQAMPVAQKQLLVVK